LLYQPIDTCIDCRIVCYSFHTFDALAKLSQIDGRYRLFRTKKSERHRQVVVVADDPVTVAPDHWFDMVLVYLKTRFPKLVVERDDEWERLGKMVR
jgi:hypothetical protein